jgi:AAA15 family ATPase/GTPase
MLDHIHIQNYRLFKDLKIDKLGQVNLIAGKNNTGKTALLEALRILASDSKINVLTEILKGRDEIVYNDPNDGYNLFNNKKNPIVTIGDFQFAIELEYEKKGEIQCPFQHGLAPYIAPLISNKYLYVPFQNGEDVNTILWEFISLTPEEDKLIEILQIIDSRINKFRYDNKKPKVLLNNSKEPIPLKKLGDGVKRVLSIGIALVNAQNKMLLLDEFEVGLHHSIQEQLWEIIFKYAKEWNIQVFATTHSQDTVKAFNYISSKEEYKNMGQYMRLQPSRKTGEIEALIYTQESLENSLDLNLETR